MTPRLTIGFLAAPLVASLAILLSSLPSSPAGREPVLEFLVFCAIYYVYAGLFMAIIGIPLFIALRRVSLVRWWSSLLAGLVVGAAGASSLNGQSTLTMMKVALAGGLAGLVFWLIARRDLPPNKSLERTRER